MAVYTIEDTFGAEIKRGFSSRAYLIKDNETAYVLQSKFAGFGKKFHLINANGECVAILRRGMFSVFSKWRIQVGETRFTLRWKGKMTQDIYIGDNGIRIESVPKANERTYVLQKDGETHASVCYGKQSMRVESESEASLASLLAVSICADW